MDIVTFERDKKVLEEALASGIRTRIEVELSPQMVDHLLAMNSEHNRKVNVQRVKVLTYKIHKYGYIPADDFKFYKGVLVNGQHRLKALKALCNALLLQKPYPRTGIVVGISKEEASIIDTAQARSMDQRIYMANGMKFDKRLRAAVSFSLYYHNQSIEHKLLNDEEVVNLMLSASWHNFVRQISPNWTMPATTKSYYLPAPIYAALKEAYDRAPYDVWKNLLDELNGNRPGKIMLKFRDIITNAPTFGYGSVGRKTLYRMCVTYLKAYINGKTSVPRKISEWD